jgi:hypothetical protein
LCLSTYYISIGGPKKEARFAAQSESDRSFHVSA